MNPIYQGAWRIRTVDVNSTPVMDSDGFSILMSNGNELAIEPAGITFKINQATARSAILESRSQIFFADFFIRGQLLTLNLSRPAFTEKVSLTAEFESTPAPDFA